MEAAHQGARGLSLTSKILLSVAVVAIVISANVFRQWRFPHDVPVGELLASFWFLVGLVLTSLAVLLSWKRLGRWRRSAGVAAGLVALTILLFWFLAFYGTDL